MSQKAVALQFERCLESSAHAQTLCPTLLEHGYSTYRISNLPERAFYRQAGDFALDTGIYYKNILFRELGSAGRVVEQPGRTLLFSANEFETPALHQGVPRPVAGHRPQEPATA